MSQESLKVLKELSMLSTNMDILVKELREQNKKNSENTEQIKKLVSDKEKKTAAEDPSKSKESQQNEGLFKNLTQSFAKEISLNNKQLTESLTKQITGDLAGITKNIISPAEVKPQTSDKASGQLISALAKSFISGIPKLEKGGDVSKDGVALVGERGPELVQLRKDQRVISNDDFLLQQELIEMRESFDKRQNESEKKTSDLVTGKSDLAESVTNSFGVNVPKREIDLYRDEIRRLNPDEFANEPALLEDEVKAFIENYRETFDPSKFTATNQEQLKSVNDQPAANAPEELSRREKRRKEREEKKAEKEKLEGVIAPTKPKLLESLKAKGKDLIGSEKAKIEKSLVEAGLLKETKKPEPKQDITGGAKLETEQFDLSTVKASDLSQLTERLKSKMKTGGEESSVKETMKSSSSSETAQAPSSATPQTTSSVSKEVSQAETNSAITQQDLKDIKALLGAIYKSLSGPLNIANDRPFRPNSNVL